MPTVSVLYCRRHSIDSAILRTAMWSQWSHQALLMPDGVHLVDATFWHGVALRDRAEIAMSRWAVREIACPRPDDAYQFALAQIGKKYDTLGTLGIGLHRDWQEPDRWFCSELVEAALVAGGNKRFINDAGRVTPQHSWMVA